MFKLRHLFFVPFSILIIGLIGSFLSSPSDDEIRSKVVKLYSSKGSCTGEQVKAPSGANYILTAGHCAAMAENGSISVLTEDGRKIQRQVIAEDRESDLLLLEGVPGLEGFDIAESNYRRQAVRTFTHGRGFMTYKTEGVIIQDRTIDIFHSEIKSDEDAFKCYSQPKFRVVSEMGQTFCIMSVIETVTTASVVHGSSGGPVLSSSGELIAVVSATDGQFGYLVRISDIRRFVAGY